jgi:hypothetical protein
MPGRGERRRREWERIVAALVAGLVLLGSIPALAEDESESGPKAERPDEGALAEAALSESELAKEAQNPVADLISVPFQNNTSYEFGPRDRTQNVMNIQPVIPVGINQDWQLITRTIFPVVSQPAFVRGQGRQDGVGDTTLTLFGSPVRPAFGRFIWGGGPIFNIPTASDDRLGADAWGLGVSGVGLVMEGPIVAGALISNTWNLEGEDFSRFLLQYFLNYNFGRGWYVSSAPIITADWEADHDAWLVPVGGGFGKVHRFGRLPINISFQAFYNAEKPEYGADWSTRVQVQFLFPK